MSGRWWGVLRSLVIYYARPGRARRLREHYAGLIEPGGVAFDIGAHVGSRTRAFRALGATVVAVEPQPVLADVLERIFQRDSRVTVDRRAVGSSPGTITLHVCATNPTVSTTSAEWAQRAPHEPGWRGVSFSEQIMVEQTTLDALIAAHGDPTFVKIDVEGAEDEVLAGVSTPLRALSIEFLPADRDVAFRSIMRLEFLAREAGGRYEYNVSLGEELRFVMPDRWWTVDELNAYLAEIPADGPSGDIYARLVADEVAET